MYPVLADFPLAKTAPFFDLPEGKEKDTGGLLSITVNPEACKGCNICVDVCPEQALITVKQDDEVVERLRRNWSFWEHLPDTDDHFVNIRDLDEGIGVLSSLLLKKENYRSMAGGDGACMGCGEKTAVHLVTSTVEALMQPRVAGASWRRSTGCARPSTGRRARSWPRRPISTTPRWRRPYPGRSARTWTWVCRRRSAASSRSVLDARKALDHIAWTYREGPTGRGRVSLGISNSTGCSSVWGSTYPYNPYPFPWVNHLFQDAPSIALGIFEGHMRKMADAFVAVRRAEAIAADAYDEEAFRLFAEEFDWRAFTDEEFRLCPPILTIGGDGAMLDIGFQNLSRLMASGKPITVMVLDTQVYSNTGGQACTSGFTGQVADMSAWGKAEHGKSEVRKELAFIAMAHRGVFVHQSSQASASHLIGGVIRALNARRPAVLNVYTPCPVEHGLADEWAPRAAKLALEGRAFPFLTYDPDGGDDLSDCLSLDGNPALDETWPTYSLEYLDEDGEPATMELPITTADWAATEVRFRKNFQRADPEAWDDAMIPFHDFMALPREERVGKVPFIWTIDADRKLERLQVSTQMVQLADDRLNFWHQLREMAGLDVPERVHDDVEAELEAELDAKLEAAPLGTRAADRGAQVDVSAQAVARRMAEGLIGFREGGATVADILADAAASGLALRRAGRGRHGGSDAPGRCGDEASGRWPRRPRPLHRPGSRRPAGFRLRASRRRLRARARRGRGR